MLLQLSQLQKHTLLEINDDELTGSEDYGSFGNVFDKNLTCGRPLLSDASSVVILFSSLRLLLSVQFRTVCVFCVPYSVRNEFTSSICFSLVKYSRIVQALYQRSTSQHACLIGVHVDGLLLGAVLQFVAFVSKNIINSSSKQDYIFVHTSLLLFVAY